jgi:branched-chain amino acid transport system ATP-binding protein
MRSTLEPSKELILEVEDLAVSYGRIQAVSGVSLRVGPGEIVTLIGANGAGKSTVLKGILGVQRACQGTVRFKGRDITRTATDRIVALGVAIVPEGRGIVAQMTVLENLELGAFHRRDRIEADLENVFQWFPVLAERKDQQAGTLSGGQQQMLALGRAMMARPDLIMMDEPSLGLAPIVVNALFENIAQLNRQGQTILLVEQNARKALQLAHRGYVFERGQVVLSGSSQELTGNEEVRKAYLGG